MTKPISAGKDRYKLLDLIEMQCALSDFINHWAEKLPLGCVVHSLNMKANEAIASEYLPEETQETRDKISGRKPVVAKKKKAKRK